MIELVVALAVFGILMVPVSQSIKTIININKSSQDNVEIASLMSSCVEYAVKNDFDVDTQTIGEYTVEYQVNEEKDGEDIAGIQNDKADIRFFVEPGILVAKRGESLVWTKTLNSDMTEENSISIKIGLLDDGRLEYRVKNDPSASDEIIAVIPEEDAVWGIGFDGGNRDNIITLSLDGVYNSSGNYVPDKSICAGYSNIKSTTKIITASPFIIVSENNPGDAEVKMRESIVEVTVTIKGKDGKELKKQTYYFTRRLK